MAMSLIEIIVRIFLVVLLGIPFFAAGEFKEIIQKDDNVTRKNLKMMIWAEILIFIFLTQVKLIYPILAGIL